MSGTSGAIRACLPIARLSDDAYWEAAGPNALAAAQTRAGIASIDFLIRVPSRRHG